MKLKRYGFFKELPHGNEDGESLLRLKGAAVLDKDTVARASEYLRTGHLLVGCPGTVVDVLDSGSTEAIGSPDILTDGCWAWPGDLAYYFTKYNIPLPAQMVNDMNRNDWRVPSVLNFDNIEF